MVDPYKGTRFEGFTGLGNDGYGSMSQGPMDNILADGFFVNDPRRPRPGMRGSSDSGIPAIPNPGSLPPAMAEADIQPSYERARAAAAEARANGMLSQELLPGEMGFEEFRRINLMPGRGLGVSTGPIDTGLGASVGRILADINMTPEERALSPIVAQNPGGGPDKDDFYAFKSTLRDPGDMGRYIAPGEEMSYEDFVKFGRPANLVAAESAGYGGGALLSDAFGNKVSLGSLAGVTPEEALKGGGLLPNSGVSGNLKDATGMPDTRGPNVPGNRPPTPTEPIDPYARPTPGMFGPTTETNPIAGISNQPGGGGVSPPVSAGTDISPQPDMTQRPMPFSGLASLTKLPMFQEFATKLESEHPEASQLFSQMFMGSSQRPMPYQNPFMGMGMGSFHPMMGGMGMGMGGYNPMMGMGGGFNPMMGGMGMGGYSPFMGMNPMMGMGGGFNPMMGMGGGGLGSFYPQPSTYGPPQSMPSMGGYPTPPQSSPFGGAMRGYYA